MATECGTVFVLGSAEARLFRRFCGTSVGRDPWAYPVTDRLDVYGRIDNATNKWYETKFQYGTWGRTAFLGVRAKL